jgi:chromosomal replication initiation ATPase DnaA
MIARQLPLSLDYPERLGAEDFLTAPTNEEAHALVMGWPNWPAPALRLVGPAGAGKSHLTAMWAVLSGARVTEAASLSPDTEQALHQGDTLAVENIDGPGVSERALFHLLNSARECGAALLLTSRRSPTAAWPALPDLASRLRALPAASLALPDGDFLRAVLVKLCDERQLVVEPGVIDYIFNRMERSLATARRLVAALDGEALARGRPISRRVAAAVLAEPGDHDDG